MKFYVNREHRDLLVVDGERCAIHYINPRVAEQALEDGIDAVDACFETLDCQQGDEYTGDATYRELIESGYYTEVSVDEI